MLPQRAALPCTATSFIPEIPDTSSRQESMIESAWLMMTCMYTMRLRTAVRAALLLDMLGGADECDEAVRSI